MKHDAFDPMRGYLDAGRTPEGNARRTTRLAIAAVSGAAVLLVIWFVFVGGGR